MGNITQRMKCMMIAVMAGLLSAAASQAAPKCQLGILDLTANGGINPATNSAWKIGDHYRFAFVTRATTRATSPDIATYNAFVTGVANSSTLNLGGATWKVIGSTATVDARDNTATHPKDNGTGEAVFLVNGTTRIANNYVGLWGGKLDHALNLDEKGVLYAGSTFTGSSADGTKDGGNVLGSTTSLTIGTTTSDSSNWLRVFGAAATSSLPVYALSDPLTIVDSADTKPPTLVSFVDNKRGGPVESNDTVTYTVTFSKKMNAATVNPNDFENASATPILVNSVTATANPAVFLVAVTPKIAGTLQLRIKAGASLTDFTGNALKTTAAIPATTTIKVNDTTPPTLTSLADDRNGSAVFADQPVTYTVTFSEAMNATTVKPEAFGNAAATAITVNSATATADPAVFQVVVTPTAAGMLRLQVKAGARLTDCAGNALGTAKAIPAATTITVNTPPMLKCQLGIVKLSANGWLNPATGKVWELGDKYRLAFVTRATTQATSTDIATYNTFVQGVANSSNLNLGGAIWKVIGSTATVDARDNTATNPLWNGIGEPIFLVDGTTDIANNYNDLWSAMYAGALHHPLNLDERGARFATSTFTGSFANGIKDGHSVLGGTANPTIGTTDKTSGNWIRVFGAPATSLLPVYALSDPLAVVSSVPLADITSMTFPGYGAATIAGTGISMTLPYRADLTKLAPTYVLSAGASCVPASGTSLNFTKPVPYRVTASDHTTKDFTVTVTTRPVADPAFSLTAPAAWDGRQTITLQPVITNQPLLESTAGTHLNYRWSVTGVAVIKQITAGTLKLIRSQGNGPLTVTLTIDNGGFASSHSVTVNVRQPATDSWVQRTPGVSEKPVDKQFYARDPNTNKGTIFYHGTDAGTTPVYLKVFATPSGGSESQYGQTLRQTPVAGSYAFSVPIAAGLVTYKVEFGTTAGSTDTPTHTVTDLVCGDAYLIEGQSNAEATNNDVPADTHTSPWIRSYGKTRGWGYATNKDAPAELQLGVWGWIWAKHLSASYRMPICIINGAVGGTRIDQHQPNPADHSQAGSQYSIYATLYNRIVGAHLTHGIRAVLWHQGEQDQGSGGPFGGDYDYKYYQQLFIDMSAAWKQDFPNVQKYYIFQIWPPACGDQTRNDQLREVQRSLPYLYSNMRAMSTLGIVPGSSCHYVLDGYQKFSDLISPLVEQDFYGYMPGGVFSAPNLMKACYSSASRNEITLEFDQDIAWNPGAPGLFYLDRLAGMVTSGSATGKVVKLRLNAPSTAQTITYLQGGTWDGVQGNLLYGKNGIAALTFADVPLAPPVSLHKDGAPFNSSEGNPIKASTGRLTASGLPSSPRNPAELHPLFDYPVRDTCVCPGPDGTYYLTGTTGHPTWWKTNEGIRVWKSKDLKSWEPLGLVWSFAKDATWQKPRDGKQAIWAPELHYFKGTFWIAYCVNYGGTGILRSKTGKADGPYQDMKPDGPLTGEIDASLFDDDDGKVYFVWQNGKIALLKDDLTGLAEKPRLLQTAHGKDVGFEGAFLTKINGRYHLICAAFNKQGDHSTYDCMAAGAGTIYGPYSDAYLAIPHGGHNTLFKDARGDWWSTFFGNDADAPFRERPAILPIRMDSQYRIQVPECHG